MIFTIDAVVGDSGSSSADMRISRTAEWTVELESVEYYPGVIWEPAHDNMGVGYSPYVRRYRNYTNGARIGPDVYQDYGHFVTHGPEFRINYNFLPNDPSDDRVGVVPESEYPDIPRCFREDDGSIKAYQKLDDKTLTLYRICKEKLKQPVNKNAFLFDPFVGIKQTNEEILFVDFDGKHIWYEYWNSDKIFAPATYFPSNSRPDWAVTDEPDNEHGFNWGQDAPVKFRTDTILPPPHVVELDRTPGWGIDVPFYATEETIRNISPSDISKPWWGWFYRDTWYELDCIFEIRYGNMILCSLYNHCQFLHIDGRMIDFLDYMMPKKPSNFTAYTERTSSGFHYYMEDDLIVYGLPLYRKTDLYVDLYDGPEEQVYEGENVGDEDNYDDEQRKNQELQNGSRSRADSQAPVFKLDTRMPQSFTPKKTSRK